MNAIKKEYVTKENFYKKYNETLALARALNYIADPNFKTETEFWTTISKVGKDFEHVGLAFIIAYCANTQDEESISYAITELINDFNL